jgi:hypothetical protein
MSDRYDKIRSDGFQFYKLLGPSRALSAVAEHFGVIPKQVCRIAKDEKWVERIEKDEPGFKEKGGRPGRRPKDYENSIQRLTPEVAMREVKFSMLVVEQLRKLIREEMVEILEGSKWNPNPPS